MNARKKVLLSKLSACLRELAEPDAPRRIAALRLLCGMSDVLTREFAIVSPFVAGLGEQPVLPILAEVISRYDLGDRSVQEQTLLSHLLHQVDSRLVSSDLGFAELSAQFVFLEELLDDETGFTLASDVSPEGQPSKGQVRIAIRQKWAGLLNSGAVSELLEWLLPVLADNDPSREERRFDVALFLLEEAELLRTDSVVREYLAMLDRVDSRTRSHQEAALISAVVVRLFPEERCCLHDSLGTWASACIARLLTDPENAELVRDSDTVRSVLSAAADTFGSSRQGG